MSDQTDKRLSHRKIRDRSMVNVLVGTVLLMPPVVGVSLIDSKIGGIPVPLLFVFGVWAGLIAVAILLARRLDDAETAPASTESGDLDG